MDLVGCQQAGPETAQNRKDVGGRGISVAMVTKYTKAVLVLVCCSIFSIYSSLKKKKKKHLSFLFSFLFSSLSLLSFKAHTLTHADWHTDTKYACKRNY